MRIVLLELALRATHNDILAAPGELLNVRTMIGQRYGATIELQLLVNMIEAIKVLIFMWQWKFVLHQIAQGNGISIVGAFSLERIALNLRAKRMDRSAPKSIKKIIDKITQLMQISLTCCGVT